MMGVRNEGIKAAETRDAMNAFCSPVFATEISGEESNEEEYRTQELELRKQEDWNRYNSDMDGDMAYRSGEE